uniref:Uncharacterized protein n=1 Tax=Triticum urartu TaxID=4572 RepID=A0A8R7PZZ7_TRIUA
MVSCLLLRSPAWDLLPRWPRRFMGRLVILFLFLLMFTLIIAWWVLRLLLIVPRVCLCVWPVLSVGLLLLVMVVLAEVVSAAGAVHTSSEPQLPGCNSSLGAGTISPTRSSWRRTHEISPTTG